MRLYPKTIKYFFLVLLLIEILGLSSILAVGTPVSAADSINLKLQSPIPGGETNIDFTNNKSTKPIADYIRVIYKYAIGVVGILATVVMMVGGIMWMISGGSPERAGEAKAYISASLTGLVLTICSYLILATVNPALVNLKISDIKTVDAPPESTKETVNTEYEKNTDGSYKCCNPPAVVPISQVNDTVYVAPTTYNSGCGAGFYCNNGIKPGIPGITNNADPCAGLGYCSPKLGEDQNCSDTINCLDGLRCIEGRCKNPNINVRGAICATGNCVSPFYCVSAGPDPGRCFDGSPGDTCCRNSECKSGNCSIGALQFCNVGDINNATYRCY